METLPSSSTQKAGIVETIFRFAIPAGLIYGGIKLFNAFAPTLLEFFDNFWKLALVGIPAAFLLIYVISNPMFIWMSYKNFCRKITSFFIKNDPLSYMESYLDILRDKRTNLEKSLTFLKGKKVKLDRLIDTLTTNAKAGMNKALAAQKVGNAKLTTHLTSLAAGDKESVELYQPIIERINKNIIFLEKLDENWGYSIEMLDKSIERKKVEYQTIKEMAAAINQAEEFAKGNTEEAKIFQESMEALEEKVSNYIANIEQFETNSKTIMENIDIEKQMLSDAGLKMLDEYEQSGQNIFLPSNYFQVNNLNNKERVPVYQNNNVGNAEFSKLLQ